MEENQNPDSLSATTDKQCGRARTRTVSQVEPQTESIEDRRCSVLQQQPEASQQVQEDVEEVQGFGLQGAA
ncbi:Hypothetical predicted protein [Scomber scombrus]|uniref:Uncharacterized protein n=1 Tax=Scomber scombrus TaxID=13677 RepID=A0AAV1QJ86_SCOSC